MSFENYLPSSAEEYQAARKYYSALANKKGPTQDRMMAQLAKEACRFAVLRKENPFLRFTHFPAMDLQPVFFAGNAATGGLPGGGFIDARREAVIVLDSVSGGLKYHSLDWQSCGSRLRFPPDGLDMMDIYR